MKKLSAPYLCLLLVAAEMTITVASKPTPFPLEFSIEFVTNITAIDDNKQHALQGKLFYSWSSRKQRIDHDPGSYECVHFYNTTKGCSLVFLPERGMYRLLEGDGDDDCCLDLAGVGTPPPDWASRANPTFNGKVHDDYSGLDTLEWAFDNLTVSTTTSHVRVLPYHTTREVAPGQPLSGVPVLFTFPGKANGRQDYHYDVNSMIVGPQDPNLFLLPAKCQNVPCEQPQDISDDKTRISL